MSTSLKRRRIRRSQRTQPQAAMAAHKQTPGLPGLASGRDYLPLPPVGSTGFEPARESRKKRHYSPERSIFVARARTEDPENEPLASWLDACPVELTDEAKAGILATVRAAKQP